MEETTKMPKNGWMKTLCVIAGILMSILGILMFIKPVATATVVVWLSFVGLFINGIIEIVKYFKAEKEERNGLRLGLGILWILISVLMFSVACGAPYQTTIRIEYVLAVMIGFTCIFTGISNICNYKKHSSAPLAIIGGILQILCGFAVLSNPLFGLLNLTILFGIYLFVMGIVYVVNTLAE